MDYMKQAVDGLPPPTTTAETTSPEKFWSDVPNGQYVQYLRTNEFDNKIKSKDTALVMFFAPCKFIILFLKSV